MQHRTNRPDLPHRPPNAFVAHPTRLRSPNKAPVPDRPTLRPEPDRASTTQCHATKTRCLAPAAAGRRRDCSLSSLGEEPPSELPVVCRRPPVVRSAHFADHRQSRRRCRPRYRKRGGAAARAVAGDQRGARRASRCRGRCRGRVAPGASDAFYDWRLPLLAVACVGGRASVTRSLGELVGAP